MPANEPRPGVVFVVAASSGDYEDVRVWNVRAFIQRADADAFAKKAKERADKLCEWTSPKREGTGTDYWYPKYNCTPIGERPVNELDHDFSGEDTVYYVEEIKLVYPRKIGADHG